MTTQAVKETEPYIINYLTDTDFYPQLPNYFEIGDNG